jgi:copper transport protein
MMWRVLLHGLALPAAAGRLALPAAAGRLALPAAAGQLARLAAASQAALTSPGAWVVAFLRWLLFAGLSGALGGLAGRGLSRQYQGVAAGPLPPPWALRSSLLGLIAAAGLAVAAAGDGSLAAGLAHPLAHRLSSSTSGVIAIIEVAGFAAAAALLRLRLAGLSVVPLLAVVGAEGVRAHPEGIIPVGGALLTYAHLLPAALWAGMLLYVRRAAIGWRSDPSAVRGLVRLYGNAAAWLFALVVGTGVVSALVLVPLGSLLTTAYGIVVIIKAAVVAVVAVLAVAGRVWLRHLPPAGAGPALVTKLECGMLAVALAITGLLTILTPPAASSNPGAARAPAVSRAAAKAARPGPQPQVSSPRTAGVPRKSSAQRRRSRGAASGPQLVAGGRGGAPPDAQGS